MNGLINIQNNNGILTVSSREVAEHFEKQHKHILPTIVQIISQMNSAENSAQYFIPSEYKDNSGKTNREYLMTRDGFALLCMGFTGRKALEWKLKYINAFNKMENTLKEIPSVAYLNGCANLINTIRRVMKDQNSSPYKIALQTELLCKKYSIPIVESFLEPSYEQLIFK